MDTQRAAHLADQITNSRILDRHLELSQRANIAESQQPVPLSSSAHTLAYDQSMLSSNVDRWMNGYPTDTGVQDNRLPGLQRPIRPPPSQARDYNGLWYILALVLPLCSLQNTWQWRCTPSAVLHSAELLLNQLSRFCHNTRTQIQRLARDQISRDIFATAMDIVLVVYAIGFLVLSLYQATLINH